LKRKNKWTLDMIFLLTWVFRLTCVHLD
jgi:hypothetical protein